MKSLKKHQNIEYGAGKGYSWLQGLIPGQPALSVTGDMKVRVPRWLLGVSKDPKVGGILWQTLAPQVLVAGAIGAYRIGRHLWNKADEDDTTDNAAKGTASRVSTTFVGELQPKQYKTASGKTGTGTGVLATVLPVGAAILAGALAYKFTDDWQDWDRNRTLDKQLAEKNDTIKRLMMLRQRLAKGVARPSELTAYTDEDDGVVKEASLQKKAWQPMDQLLQSTALLQAALFTAGGVQSYAYFSATDPKNIQHAQQKKGMKEFAKQKQLRSPISIIPTDAAELFRKIDGQPKQPLKVEQVVAEALKRREQPEQPTPREQPEVSADNLNQPISITL